MHERRWAIYIDLEGFSALYDRENHIMLALGDLMEGIFLIGEKCYPESPERIFAHQTGDGFVIVSEFGAESLEIPVAISICLLRHIAARGRFGKAAIGEGDFADVTGCYPQTVREAQTQYCSVRMGGSVMTLFSVMGTALIDAVRVAKRSPSGSLLTLRKKNRSRIPQECEVKQLEDQEIICIDWVHSELLLVPEIQNRAKLRNPSLSTIEKAFTDYAANQMPPKQWVNNTGSLLGFADEALRI